MLAAKLKRLAKDSLIYGLGDALGRLINLIMLPILARAFAPEDYGAIDILTITYTFLLMGVSLNIFPGISKNYYKLPPQDQKILVSSAGSFLTVLALVVTFLLVPFSPLISVLMVNSGELTMPIMVLACCLPVELLLNVVQHLLRIQNKAVPFTVSNIARVIITPLLTYFMVIVLQTGIVGVFYSKFITLFLLTATLFLLERKQFVTNIRFGVFRRLVRFTMPGFPGVMIKQLMTLLPRLVLAFFAPLSAVGLFGIASRISQTMNLLVMAFNRAWGPFAFANADKPGEDRLYSIIFKVFALILLVIGLGLSLFAREVIFLLTPAQYHSAHYMVGGIVLYFGLRGLTMIFGTALYVAEQVKWTSYLQTLQLVCFMVVALWLVPQYLVLGLIIALDVSALVHFICYIFIVRRYFIFTIPLARLSIVLLLACSLVVFFAFFDKGLILTISLKLTAALCYFMFSLFFLFTAEEQAKSREIAASMPLLKNYLN